MKPYKVGLVVGKFSPLHKGHEFLINTALSQVDKLYVLSWSNPELVDSSKIQIWLNTLFPTAHCTVLTQSLIDKHNTALIDTIPSIPLNDSSAQSQRYFTAMYWEKIIKEKLDIIFSSEHYGTPFAKAMTHYLGYNVESKIVDVDRTTWPISATQIRNRNSLLDYKEFLSPIVYNSLVKRVLFLGGESTGKTTLVTKLHELTGHGYVLEFGRELWDAKNGNLEFNDMLFIAETQLRREKEQLNNCSRVLLCDTSAITTAMYSNHMFSYVDSELENLANESIKQYDYVFLCDTDIPLDQDGTRNSDNNFRINQNKQYIEFLNNNNIKYTLLSGSIKDRIKTVESVVHNFTSLNIIVN